MADQDFKHIEVAVEEDGGLLSIVLAGGKGNILGMDMMAEIERALHIHTTDDKLRMVLISASEKYFSYGASVEEHVKSKVRDMIPTFHRFIRTVALAQVPVAALVQGPCLGGAFEMVLACHLVFATPRAKFACPEIKLGVFPPVLAAIGAQQLGGATADRLILSGGDLSASDAKSCGWLTELIEDGDPKQVVRDWYRDNLAPLSAFSLRRATWAARHAGGMAERLGAPLAQAEKHYLDVLVPSHDGNEGIEAFIEQRKPVWRHA